MRKKTKKGIKKITIFKLMIVLIIGLILLMVNIVDARLAPVVQKVAQTRTQSIVTQAVNNTITDELEKLQLTYLDLVTLERDEDGEIVSLSYDALEMNKLKSLMTTAVLQSTDKIQPSNIYIPIGNITEIDFFQNKGPSLAFTIIPTAYVEVDIETEFINTGINQVNHRISLVFDITADALISRYTTGVSVNTKVCVAETIIVGEVPNNIGSNSLLISE